jgi:hypothetical protein
VSHNCGETDAVFDRVKTAFGTMDAALLNRELPLNALSLFG